MPFNFGSFAGGLAEGMQRGQQLALQAQEAKLKQKMIDAQMKHQDFLNQQLQQKITADEQARQLQQQAADALKASYTGGTPSVPGYESPEQQMSVAPVPAKPGPTAMTPQQTLIHAAVSQGKFPAGAFTQAAQPADLEAQLEILKKYRLIGQGGGQGEQEMGFTINPKTGVTTRINPVRHGVGVESDTWNRVIKENPGADLATLRGIYNREIGNTAQSRGAGAQQGALDVKQTPGYLQNQTDIATAKEVGKPLETSERQAIGAMESTMRVARELKQNFTPEDLNRYVGYLKFPANRIGQLGKADPKFAQFQTLVNQVKGTAFSEGGKQLTPFEAGITFGHIPTGTEFSTADFIAKLDNTLKETQNRINDRLRLSTQPRSQIGSPGASGQGRLVPRAPR